MRPDLEACVGTAESIVGKALLDPVAARTAQSTREITAMIERIRASTGQAINSMATGVSRVSEGV